MRVKDHSILAVLALIGAAALTAWSLSNGDPTRGLASAGSPHSGKEPRSARLETVPQPGAPKRANLESAGTEKDELVQEEPRSLGLPGWVEALQRVVPYEGWIHAKGRWGLDADLRPLRDFVRGQGSSASELVEVIETLEGALEFPEPGTRLTLEDEAIGLQAASMTLALAFSEELEGEPLEWLLARTELENAEGFDVHSARASAAFHTLRLAGAEDHLAQAIAGLAGQIEDEVAYRTRGILSHALEGLSGYAGSPELEQALAILTQDHLRTGYMTLATWTTAVGTGSPLWASRALELGWTHGHARQGLASLTDPAFLPDLERILQGPRENSSQQYMGGSAASALVRIATPESVDMVLEHLEILDRGPYLEVERALRENRDPNNLGGVLMLQSKLEGEGKAYLAGTVTGQLQRTRRRLELAQFGRQESRRVLDSVCAALPHIQDGTPELTSAIELLADFGSASDRKLAEEHRGRAAREESPAALRPHEE